jgi:hypothetical protein
MLITMPKVRAGWAWTPSRSDQALAGRSAPAHGLMRSQIPMASAAVPIYGAAQRRSRSMLTNGDLDLFEMANLYPRTTGLPMTVWVSPKGHARHDARVKVNTTHGQRMDLDNAAVVAIRPTPRLIEGALSPSDQTAVAEWVTHNRDALIDFWDGTIDTAELIGRLVKV